MGLGPAYVTSGIAGPAYIELQESVVKLKDLHVMQAFPGGKEDLSVVDVTVSVTLDGGDGRHENVTFNLFVDEKKEATLSTTVQEDSGEDAVIELS